jgi:guanylate kinase
VTARDEASSYVDYDYVVVNDDLEATVVRLQEIIAAERSRVHRMGPIAQGILRSFNAEAQSAGSTEVGR